MYVLYLVFLCLGKDLRVEHGVLRSKYHSIPHLLVPSDYASVILKSSLVTSSLGQNLKY